MNVELFVGMVFRTSSGCEFGTIRKIPESGSQIFPFSLNFTPIAMDDCGNYFVKDVDGIYFWDHENDHVELLAKSESEFIAGLVSRKK